MIKWRWHDEGDETGHKRTVWNFYRKENAMKIRCTLGWDREEKQKKIDMRKYPRFNVYNNYSDKMEIKIMLNYGACELFLLILNK